MTAKHFNLYVAQGGKCFYCDRPMEMGGNGYLGWSLDHKRPRKKGGSDKRDNLVLCCRECNSIKSELDFDAFMASLAIWKQMKRCVSIYTWQKIMKRAYRIYGLQPNITRPEAMRIAIANLEKIDQRQESFEDFIKHLASEIEE